MDSSKHAPDMEADTYTRTAEFPNKISTQTQCRCGLQQYARHASEVLLLISYNWNVIYFFTVRGSPSPLVTLCSAVNAIDCDASWMPSSRHITTSLSRCPFAVLSMSRSESLTFCHQQQLMMTSSTAVNGSCQHFTRLPQSGLALCMQHTKDAGHSTQHTYQMDVVVENCLACQQWWKRLRWRWRIGLSCCPAAAPSWEHYVITRSIAAADSTADGRRHHYSESEGCDWHF